MQPDDSIKWENLKVSLEFCNLVKHAETVDQTILNHLMLLGVQEPLVAGDTVALTLTFETSPPLEVTATVGQPPLADSDPAAE